MVILRDIVKPLAAMSLRYLNLVETSTFRVNPTRSARPLVPTHGTHCQDVKPQRLCTMIHGRVDPH